MISKEDLLRSFREGAREAVRELLSDQGFRAELALAIADRETEVLTPDGLARMLEIDRRSLRRNGAKIGLVKSLALGHNHPRYYRSQVLEVLHAGDKDPRADLRGNGGLAHGPATACPGRRHLDGKGVVAS